MLSQLDIILILVEIRLHKIFRGAPLEFCVQSISIARSSNSGVLSYNTIDVSHPSQVEMG